MDLALLPFFKPRGVVIGASASPEKLGYGVARNLIASGYQGAIHLVSQKSGKLFERPLYRSLRNVPDPVDLAIVIVPPQSTPPDKTRVRHWRVAPALGVFSLISRVRFRPDPASVIQRCLSSLYRSE